MNKIIFIEPKTISVKDKQKLTKNGYLVIEHPIPSSVRIVVDANEVEANILLMSAMKGVTEGIGSNEKFVKELYRRLQLKETKL